MLLWHWSDIESETSLSSILSCRYTASSKHIALSTDKSPFSSLAFIYTPNRDQSGQFSCYARTAVVRNTGRSIAHYFMFEINEIKMPHWRWAVRDNHSCHLPCTYTSINMQNFLPLLYWFSPTALPASYILMTPVTFLLIVLYVCEIGPLFPNKKRFKQKTKIRKVWSYYCRYFSATSTNS